MQGHFFEVIISAVRFEHAQVFVGQKRKRKPRLLFGLRNGLIETFNAIGADGNDTDAGLFEIASGRAEQIQLFDAMGATGSEIKYHQHRPAAKIIQ